MIDQFLAIPFQCIVKHFPIPISSLLVAMRFDVPMVPVPVVASCLLFLISWSRAALARRSSSNLFFLASISSLRIAAASMAKSLVVAGVEVKSVYMPGAEVIVV